MWAERPDAFALEPAHVQEKFRDEVEAMAEDLVHVEGFQDRVAALSNTGEEEEEDDDVEDFSDGELS